MYKIFLTPRARKQLKDLSKKLHREAISLAMNDLREDPYLGKKLGRELKYRYSYRIGVYRIIYRIFEKEQIVEVYMAGHRSVVYD